MACGQIDHMTICLPEDLKITQQSHMSQKYMFQKSSGLFFFSRKTKRLRQAHRPQGGWSAHAIVTSYRYTDTLQVYRHSTSIQYPRIQVQTPRYKSRHPKDKTRNPKYRSRMAQTSKIQVQTSTNTSPDVQSTSPDNPNTHFRVYIAIYAIYSHINILI